MSVAKEYDGREIAGVKMIVTNTGDGLSDSMRLDPIELHHRDRVNIVMTAEVRKVRHDLHAPSDESDDRLDLVYVLRAGTAMIVDDTKVAKLLVAQREKVERAKGNETLPGMGVEDGDKS